MAVCEGKTAHFLWRVEYALQEGGTALTPVLVLPLLARGNVLGALALQDQQDVCRHTSQTFWLETLANLAAHALQYAALARDLLRQQEELRTLIEVGQDLSASLELDEVLRRVVRQATQLMRGRMCSLMLIDAREETFRIQATYGASQTYTQRPPLAIAESLIGNVVRTGMPMAVLDVREHAQYHDLEMARQEGLCSLLSVPLKTNTRVIGVLNLYTTERRRFQKEDAEFLSAMVAQSATAIANAQLYRTMLETQERLRQSECLAALGSMAAGLAHEIRNPLHTMQLLVSAMQQDSLPHSPRGTDTEVMQHEIRRLTLLTEQFLDFARPAPPQIRGQKLHEIMEDTLLIVGAEARRSGIALHKRWQQDLPIVWVDAAQLKQVFLNVLLNALQAMPCGGAIDIQMYADQQTITTCVQDQGEGIPPEVQPQLFTPFFTTKPQGTGLGLSISQRIVEGHGGCIRITSQREAGTTVYIILPLTSRKRP
jgi:signal transduction histidine kinase